MYQRQDIAESWAGQDPLQTAFALEGEVYRDMPGRRTLKVAVGGSDYFVKLHYGVGWTEVIKNWLQFKKPVVGAKNEFMACSQLAELGIVAPVPAAYGASAGNLAQRQSFVLCDALVGFTTLEDLTATWRESPPSPQLRIKLLYAVADFAKNFHHHGFIHRDFYICHLLVNDQALQRGEVQLAVLDLHRARRFKAMPDRWLKRDLSALLFSTMVIPLNQREWLRFLRRYSGQPLKTELGERGSFWGQVVARAHKLYAKDQSKNP